MNVGFVFFQEIMNEDAVVLSNVIFGSIVATSWSA